MKKPAMKKLFAISLFTLLLGLPLSTETQAQARLGVHTGFNLDAPADASGLSSTAEEGAFLVGAEARVRAGSLPIEVNPSASYHFTGIEGAALWQFDLNVLYPFGTQNALFTPYAGLGAGVAYISSDELALLTGDEATTDVGLNLIGGASFNLGALEPFVQAKVSFGEYAAYPNDGGEAGSAYTLTGGVLFRLGR